MNAITASPLASTDPIEEHQPLVRVNETSVDVERLRRIVERFWEVSGRSGPPPSFDNIDGFRAMVPIMDGAQYASLADAVYENRGTSPVYVGGSSGTTGKSKLVLSRILPPNTPPSELDIALIRQLRRGGLAGPGDVFANLFMVGHFSILHHGMNKILEGCQASIVPVGSLHDETSAKQIDFLQRCGVNGLTGTPGSLLQLANQLSVIGRTLPIERILYTGEAFGRAKRARVAQVFPGARIVGLYGLSECGFIGIETETDALHTIRDDAYFLEIDERGRLLVTGIDPTQTVPIVRYAAGDGAELVRMNNAILLRGVERSGRDFNFMGNLIELDCIRGAIGRSTGLDQPEIEVRLSTDLMGRDVLTIGIFAEALEEAALDRARSMLLLIPEIREAIEKNAGDVTVTHRTLDAFSFTPRQKQRVIIDSRH